MLLQADKGFLLHAPDNVKREFPQLPAMETHAELMGRLKAELGGSN
jgi:hypothetical protein